MSSTSPTKAAFNWQALKLPISIAAILLWALAVFDMTRGLENRRSERISEFAADPDSRVTRVNPAGPATGKLQVGDRILAVNGYSGFFPPLHTARRLLAQFLPGDTVKLLVEREGKTHQLSFTIQGVPIPLNWFTTQGIYYLLSLSFLAAGLVAFWVKPALPAARWFGLGVWLAALAFADKLADIPALNGWSYTPTARWLSLIGDLYAPVTYFFFRNFPAPTRSRTMAVLDRFVVAACILLYLYAVWVLKFILFPLPLGWWLGSLRPTLYLGLVPHSQIALPLFAALSVVAAIHSYRRTTQPDDRRRAALLLLAVGSSLALMGAAIVPQDLEWLMFANVYAGIVPFAFVYAIVKHRVMGIQVIIRLGLQYLLAKWVLIAALAAPVLASVYRVISNPSIPAAELFGGPAQATLMAGSGVLLFAREPLLRSLDRRFFREAWDTEHVLGALLSEIQHQNSFSALADTVISHLNRAFHPSMIDVYHRLERGGGFHAIGREPVPATSPLGQWLDSGPAEPVLVANLPRGIELPFDPGPEALIVPLQASSGQASFGQASGFLLLGEKRSQEPWTRQDRSLLRLLAAQLGLSHEVILLADDREAAVEDERKRMARELHDTLSQGFAGIFLHLESASELMQDDPDQSRVHVEKASRLARSSLSSARQSVRNLRTFGEGFDLTRELHDLAARFTTPTLNIACQTDAEHPVPDDIAWHLLRIAEESVTNAIKHARASQIAVRLRTTPDTAHLTIRDNGQGFDPAAPRKAGYGMLGMAERAAQLAGSLHVASPPGSGAEITLQIPLPAT